MKRLPLFLLLIFGFISAVTPIPPAQADTPRQEYISYQGVEIFTEVYNYSTTANEAVIFLPGLGRTHTDAQFLHDPSNPYMTISLDYLSHGQSGTVANLTWDVHLDSIKAVIEAYNIKKVNLVGHSFGADTAIMFANKYPKSVKKVVLLDRAYYNFGELEDFNLTRSLAELLEFTPDTLAYEAFVNFMDMSYDNDISEAWNLKKKLLLLGSNPAETFIIEPSIPEIIFLIKTFPEWFGFAPEQVTQLPDISEEDILNLVSFLNSKMGSFAEVNHRFQVVYTPYPHGMIFNPENAANVLNYILGYLKNGKVE